MPADFITDFADFFLKGICPACNQLFSKNTQRKFIHHHSTFSIKKMGVLIFLLVSYLLTCFTLAPLFEKAGIERSKAWIPGVNFMEWAKLVGRKPSFALWMLFPIVNFFIWCGLAVDLVRSFGKLDFGTEAMAVIWAPFAFWKTDKSGAKYNGPILQQEAAYHQQIEDAAAKKDERTVTKLTENSPYKKGVLREWTEAIVFAVFAASFIRMFLIEAYVIPTSSMEGSLLVGDFLFVSKAHYGIRTPMTVAQFPLVHNRLPIGDLESYSKKPSLDYFRLPAFEKIDRMEPVVFNFPEGDSVFVTPTRTYSIMDLRGLEMSRDPQFADDIANMKKAGLTTRPIDKKDHYIKRCVGLPGDSLAVRGGQLYINGAVAANPPGLQTSYQVSQEVGFKFLENIGVNMNDISLAYRIFNLNDEQVGKIKALGPNVQVIPYPMRPSHAFNIFPKDTNITKTWTMDNFGPIYIPKAGATVKISPANINFYARVIHHYEGNELAVRGGKVLINGTEATEYTFKQNYYWMMGDNRHNSEDSRVWGYVPEDHVVGKPLFVWMSIRAPETFANRQGPGLLKRIRWDRIFSGATRK